MTVETSVLTLIRTKMQRLQLPGDLIPRRQLVDRLCAGSSRKLTRISAQVCAGPEGIMEQEQEYLTALGTAATYHIGGDSMEMRIAERSIVASFQIVKYTQNPITDRRKSNGNTNRMEV